MMKIRAARAGGATGSNAGGAENAASTISKAKEALAKARAGAAGSSNTQAGGLSSSHSSVKVAEGVGVISDKPFTLYGKVKPPTPKALPQITPPSKDENAKRK
jgi:hypothetical protein